MVALLIAAAPASAQVTIDLHALDAPAASGTAAPDRPARTRTERPRRTKSRQATKPATKPAIVAQPATPPPPPTPPPVVAQPAPPPPATLPVAPPPVVSLAPGAPLIPAPDVPPPAPAIAPDAGGGATPIPGGLRVIFAAGRGDISPESEAALTELTERTGRAPAVTYTILAYAAASPDDPSTPRRESLSRALTVRGALIAAGVESARITTRALGAPPAGDTPADRVDVTVNGGSPRPPAPTFAPPPRATPEPPAAFAAPPPPPLLAPPKLAPVAAPVTAPGPPPPAPPAPPPRVDLEPPLVPSRPPLSVRP